jgi:putative hemolysin
MTGTWVELVLVTVAIVANGVFAAAEISLVSARVSRLADLARRGVRGAATARRLKETPETFLATIQIAITAVGTLASAVGGAAAADLLAPTLGRLGLGGAAEPVALGLVILVITYVSLVIGELTPKAVALRDPEGLACVLAPVVHAISRISAAAVRLLTASTGALLRLAGLGSPPASPFVSEDDVRFLVREGAAKGIFEPVEEELVQSAFEFADTTVREVMTPRPAIQALDVGLPPERVVPEAARIGYSSIPVYRDSPDNLVGIVGLKDLLQAVAAGPLRPLADLMRPPLFVPETGRISVVLRQLQRSRQRTALVVDEYGAVVGLVTIEDIVEEIVGEIDEDRSSRTSGLVARRPDGSLIADGMARLEDLARDHGIPVEPSAEYTTAAGLVIARLQSIPRPGTSVVHAGHRWTVLATEGPRLTRIRIEPLEKA